MDTSLINNDIFIDTFDNFAAIIGENPSSGARSPKLWNAVFNQTKLNYSMVPIDVSSNKLFDLLDNLQSESRFIGGAVAVPYKEEVFKWLGDNVTFQAKKIGAVNCLFRKNNGQIFGTNTDGEAALKTYEKAFGAPSDKKILLLGLGGAAKAVAAYFSKDLGDSGKMWICGRKNNGSEFARSLDVEYISWDRVDEFLTDLDILINCTSVGFGDQENFSPLSIKQINKLNDKVIVFDIIYQPLNTILLKQAGEKGLKSLNGLNMNLEQAVLAYEYAVKTHSSRSEIRNFMKEV
jgi:shikimate dehydrogenase